MKLTQEQIQKFELLNNKIRAEEIRARDYLLKLRQHLETQKKENQIDDFEIVVEASVFSYDEDFCRSKNVEFGDPFAGGRKMGFHLAIDDDEFFNMNWFINGWLGLEQLEVFHMGYLMHCIIDHTTLSIEDILKIDDVWIDVQIRYQFFTEKSFL